MYIHVYPYQKKFLLTIYFNLFKYLLDLVAKKNFYLHAGISKVNIHRMP